MIIILDIVHRGVMLTVKVYFNTPSSEKFSLSTENTFVNDYFYPKNLSRAGKGRATLKSPKRRINVIFIQRLHTCWYLNTDCGI